MKALREALDGSQNFWDLLIACWCEPTLQIMWRQLMWQLGGVMQHFFISMVSGKRTDATWKTNTVDMLNCLSTPWLMDRRLLLYTQAVAAAHEGVTNYSGATDKSSCGGLGAGIQNTVMVLSNNQAASLVTQVPQPLIRLVKGEDLIKT